MLRRPPVVGLALPRYTRVEYHLSERRRTTMTIQIDPVCGMQVDDTTALLWHEHDGVTYWFCGKGCLLEFKDDPEKYLSPDHVPSM
jgi:YHS domain-containing protein